MTPDLIAAYLKAYLALDALPNFAKEATEAGTTMHNIRALLAEHGVSVEPMQ
jgi:hypothetical protein